mmetsp:Transcript_50372/g.129775  ORF Transcript_50372/g.129775 Transcript_50372/m.129775 type:complete len:89 (-) Transcript_50372:1684-1950(-)
MCECVGLGKRRDAVNQSALPASPCISDFEQESGALCRDQGRTSQTPHLERRKTLSVLLALPTRLETQYEKRQTMVSAFFSLPYISPVF